MKSALSSVHINRRHSREMNPQGALRVGLNCGLRSAKLRSWRYPKKRRSFAGNLAVPCASKGLAAPISHGVGRPN
jgi:hypothetical protein